MHLVGILEDVPRVCLTTVDHEQDGIVAPRQREAVEEVGQGASRRQRDIEAAQWALRRASLQRRVQMNTYGDIYQLKRLSRSDSDAS